jgi:hypothetical protein
LTWEEELQQQPRFFVIGNEHHAQQPQRTLAQWLEDAATAGSCTLSIYDKGYENLLTLQPQPDPASKEPHPLKTLGKIEITYERAYMNPEKNRPHEMLPLYLQTWATHIHWAEVICMLFKPLYALSYQQEDLKLDFLDSEEGQYIEEPLLANKLPYLTPMLIRTGLQYFGPQLLTERHEWVLRPKPFEFTETLPTGGRIIVPRHEPFDYGYGIGQQLVNKGRELYGEEGDEIDEEKEAEGERIIARGNAIMDMTRKILKQG